jgi:hypothetical protein
MFTGGFFFSLSALTSLVLKETDYFTGAAKWPILVGQKAKQWIAKLLPTS